RAAIPGVAPVDVALIAVVAGAGMAYGCLAAVYRASVRWLVVILTVETFGTAAQCAGSAAVVAAHGSVTGLLQVPAVGPLMQLAAAAIGWPLISPRDRLRLLSPRSTWHLIHRALPFAAAGVIANVQARLGTIVLGLAGTSADVAAFGIAQRFEGM